ncbi:UDP-N-acetylmuramoylalanyl-D-glutamate--2,6-diaminopimelate ligase [Adlercreutzia aquisgranensis]|uniref:UDP-N-acetylmuramoylalanyl-D-glutamate--2, 6-diaminopimelate ligase n=1 Tax=Muribaculaceae bacterium Z82 TaxID=2304548 RepID=A0A7C9JCQ0_9BACT|nr:UDP-N-acetylmuramoylalanyl-D-glutamate--2,6-diaminopimelate ligase [Adlercreutzia aquisgranensis]
MANRRISCPSCRESTLDVTRYDSMMVLKSDVALFSLHCPACGARVSAIQSIPFSLRGQVAEAAAKVHAGMLKDSHAE